MKDVPFCFWHNPANQEEAAEARRLGGLRRRREKTLAGAFDFEGLELYVEVMAERTRQLALRHEAVRVDRRQRSLRWGRRRYARKYRAEHGQWPCEVMQKR